MQKTQIHVCPNGCSSLLATSAHVVQTWAVDATGRFVDIVSTDETTHGPDNDNIWSCLACGAESELVDCTAQTIASPTRDTDIYRVYRPIANGQIVYWSMYGTDNLHQASVLAESNEEYIMAIDVRLKLSPA